MDWLAEEVGQEDGFLLRETVGAIEAQLQIQLGPVLEALLSLASTTEGRWIYPAVSSAREGACPT